jgi:hypothetical protein
VLYAGKKARVYDLEVAVNTARIDKSSDPVGDTDCSEFVGEVVEIRLQIPRRFSPPAAGDKVAFKYSQVDGFDATGRFAGTSINGELIRYQRSSPTAER